MGSIAAIFHKTVIKRLRNKLMSPVGVKSGGNNTEHA
jgi:hypothetical protein